MATLHDTALGSDTSSSTTASTADALAVTAGDLVVAHAKWEGNDGATISFDTGAATPAFTLTQTLVDYTATPNTFHSAMGYWTATSTGTVTPRMVLNSARDWKFIKAYSFTPSGGMSLNLDATATAGQGNSSSPASGSASATGAGCAVTGISIFGSAGLTAGSGWTEPAEFNVSESSQSEYQLQSGSGSLTGDGTLSISIEWIAQMAIWKEVSAGSYATAWLVA